MRAKDIKIDSIYKHKDDIKKHIFCMAKEIIPPKTGINQTGCVLVRVVLSQDKDCSWGIIKYFKASDLVKINE